MNVFQLLTKYILWNMQIWLCLSYLRQIPSKLINIVMFDKQKAGKWLYSILPPFAAPKWTIHKITTESYMHNYMLCTHICQPWCDLVCYSHFTFYSNLSTVICHVCHQYILDTQDTLAAEAKSASLLLCTLVYLLN